MADNERDERLSGEEIEQNKNPVLSFPDFGDCEDAYMRDGF